ncbi:MAG: class I SAM-dependent rRNA methyltransferase [Chloroflexi bacterium]|nr:class I SAM-dependent rRNA methyltransferase [Chloroflexota bacterium]
MTTIETLEAADWTDYALLDSGDGMRLERFGAYTLARPDPEVIWRKRWPEAEWAKADATFQHGESGERWTRRRPIPEQWPMGYHGLTFSARLTPFKHTGVFPEQAALWSLLQEQISRAARTVNILTLFGYTGLAALSAARAGAKVTYVDASKWAMEWARENQQASGLAEKPIRWLLDDALKFVKREIRRGAHYELSDRPLFVIATAYAVEVSSLALGNVVSDALGERGGTVAMGELTLREQSAGRRLSTAVYAYWHPASHRLNVAGAASTR